MNYYEALIIVNHLSKFEELKKKMHDHMCQGSGLIVLGFSPVLPEFPDFGYFPVLKLNSLFMHLSSLIISLVPLFSPLQIPSVFP